MPSVYGWYYHLLNRCLGTHQRHEWYPNHNKQCRSYTKRQVVSFFIDSVDYLGQIIKPGGPFIDQTHTQGFTGAKPATRTSAIYSLLDLCNFYRLFKPAFMGIAHPLNKLLYKRTPEQLELKEELLVSFKTLIENIS